MAKTNRTNLICLDQHRSFADDLRMRFSDPLKYNIVNVSSSVDLVKYFENASEKTGINMAVIVIKDRDELSGQPEHLTLVIKRIDPRAGIFIICPGDRIDEIRKRLKFNIDAFVAKNDNANLRLHNAMKRHISSLNLEKRRQRRNTSFVVLVLFVFLAAAAIIFARLKFPHYF